MHVGESALFMLSPQIRFRLVVEAQSPSKEEEASDKTTMLLHLSLYGSFATDSTIHPPPKKKPATFFNERLAAARHEEGRYYKNGLHMFYCLQRAIVSNDDVEVARGTVTNTTYGRGLVS